MFDVQWPLLAARSRGLAALRLGSYVRQRLPASARLSNGRGTTRILTQHDVGMRPATAELQRPEAG